MTIKARRFSLVLLLGAAAAVSAEEPCKTEAVAAGEQSTAQINSNFQCLDAKLSRILGLLEDQAKARQKEKPKPGEAQNFQDQYKYTFRDITIYLSTASLNETAAGVEVITGWNIRNLSSQQVKQVMVIPAESSISVTGQRGRLHSAFEGMAKCTNARDARVCAARDETQWTLVPENRVHHFSMFTNPPVRAKLASRTITVNVRLLVRDADGWEFMDVSFPNIAL